MLTSVQVLPGATSVARFGEVLVWFETGPQGGGTTLTRLLETVQAVSSGYVPSILMGAHLAAVLNGPTSPTTATDGTVPALVAATPEGDGLRVVVHGWGMLVTDGVQVPNGWVDQVIGGRSTYFLGRNTVTPLAPVAGSALDLEDGVVPGDGASFGLNPTGAQAVPAYPAEPVPTPTPTHTYGQVQASLNSQHPQDPSILAIGGRLVLDDGSAAVLVRSCVLGSAPYGSPAVQTGVALPLIVIGPGVAAIHAEIRVEKGQVTVRDLGSGPTYLLPRGAQSWAPLPPGQRTPIAPGTAIALGQRTISYEQP